MKVTIVGAGFVGTATAVSLAEQGHFVTLVERDATRVAQLCRGVVPFYEPGLGEALNATIDAKRLEVTRALQAAPPPDVVILAVGTPTHPDGSANLTFLKGAVEEVARLLPSWSAPTIVIKSTVPPGTTRRTAGGRLAASGSPFHLAMNPEFLREGCALADARAPDRIVLGCADRGAEDRLRELYSSLSSPILVTDLETAEAIKYTANALLATKVAFANEIANLCDALGVNVDRVMEGVGSDRRIGPHFLRAGVGFGGSCFPKDLAALTALARHHGVELGIVDAVLRNNHSQPLRVVELAREELGGLQGRRVALLGLAFKADTSDVRETRALPIYRTLVAAGADVLAYDPKAGDEFRKLVGEPIPLAASAREAIAGADAAILQTEWPEFRDLRPADFRQLMRTPVLVDGRRWLDGAALREAGIRYRGLGDGVKR